MRLPRHIKKTRYFDHVELKCQHCGAEHGIWTDVKELERQWAQQFVEAHRHCKPKKVEAE